MSSKCNYCLNKTECESCKKDGWLAKFIPSEEVKHYFSRGYNGVRGFDGKNTYDFNNTNPDLKETHSVLVNGVRYCPYCGEKMFSIQANITRYDDYSITGYCCICKGARFELGYEKERKELEERHERESHELRKKYHESLKFNSEKLFKIKQENEKKAFESWTHEYSHFSSFNNETIEDIKQITR